MTGRNLFLQFEVAPAIVWLCQLDHQRTGAGIPVGALPFCLDKETSGAKSSQKQECRLSLRGGKPGGRDLFMSQEVMKSHM